MSLITFAPPHTDAVARQAQVIGDVFPSVVIAARAGAEWAWTALHRCVAPPATGYLRAAGAEDPDSAFERLFVKIAQEFASFEGDETDFKIWVFELAHQHVISGLGIRPRRPSHADLRVLSRLSEGPAIPAAVERAHVRAAAAAAGVSVPKPRSRVAHGRSVSGGVLAALIAVIVGPVGKVGAGVMVATAVTTGMLAIDPLPQEAATPVAQAPADVAHDGSGNAAASAQRKAGARSIAGAATGGSDKGQVSGQATGKERAKVAKAAGLEVAAGAPDRAGARKDKGLQRAAAAPKPGGPAGETATREPSGAPHRPTARQPAPRPTLGFAMPQKGGVPDVRKDVGAVIDAVLGG